MKKLWLALALLGLATAPSLAQVIQTVPIAQSPQLIPRTGNMSGTTGAISASIAAATNRISYVCGFTITSNGTTSPVSVTATLSNTIGGNMTFIYLFPSTTQGLLALSFPGCIASRATNTAISINVPGSGGVGTIASTNIWGYTN